MCLSLGFDKCSHVCIPHPSVIQNSFIILETPLHSTLHHHEMQGHMNFCPRCFIVFHFTFRHLGYLELIYVYSIKYVSRLMYQHLDVQVFQCHDLERLSFLHKNGFESLSKELTLFVQVYKSQVGKVGRQCCSGHLHSYSCVPSKVINSWQECAQEHSQSGRFFYSFFCRYILLHMILKRCYMHTHY